MEPDPVLKEAVMGSTRSWGLPDDAFEQRRPLKGQITKREVRAVSLYSLGLKPDAIVWDIGAGTGSVSIEASFIATQGQVFAIERDEDSIGLLQRNVEQFNCHNVQVVVGEAPLALSELPDPDSVFIGGSGGNLSAILNEVVQRLKPQGRLVVNLAVLERTNEVYHSLREKGWAVEMVMVNAARSKEMPDDTVRFESLNPVFVVTAKRESEGNE